MNEEWDEKTELMTQAVMIEQKNKQDSSKENKNIRKVVS